jgi:hypothetical protein
LMSYTFSKFCNEHLLPNYFQISMSYTSIMLKKSPMPFSQQTKVERWGRKNSLVAFFRLDQLKITLSSVEVEIVHHFFIVLKIIVFYCIG